MFMQFLFDLLLTLLYSSRSLLLPLTPAISINSSTATHLFAPFAAKWRNKLLDEKDLGTARNAAGNNQQKKIEKSSAHSSSSSSAASARRFSRKKEDQEAENTEDDWMTNPSFSAALSLLRANVISVCLRCGVPGTALWPHEAVLLNLDLLHKKCLQESMMNPCDTPEVHLKFKSSTSSVEQPRFPTFHRDTNTMCEDDDKIYLPGLIRKYESQRILKMSCYGENGQKTWTSQSTYDFEKQNNYMILITILLCREKGVRYSLLNITRGTHSKTTSWCSPYGQEYWQNKNYSYNLDAYCSVICSSFVDCWSPSTEETFLNRWLHAAIYMDLSRDDMIMIIA